MAAPTYDDSEWPLVRIRMPAAVSRAEFDASLDYIDGLFARGERFAVLMDVRGSAPPSAAQRKAVAARMVAMFRIHPTRMAGMALVMSSAIERGIMTAIQWLAKSNFPTRPFASVSEAEGWLRAQLRAGS